MYEVADSVEFWLPLDEACRRCAWARCFLLSPALVEKQGGRAKRELFTFLVAVSLLAKIKVIHSSSGTLTLISIIRIRLFEAAYIP